MPDVLFNLLLFNVKTYKVKKRVGKKKEKKKKKINNSIFAREMKNYLFIYLFSFKRKEFIIYEPEDKAWDPILRIPLHFYQLEASEDISWTREREVPRYSIYSRRRSRRARI